MRSLLLAARFLRQVVAVILIFGMMAFAVQWLDSSRDPSEAPVVSPRSSASRDDPGYKTGCLARWRGRLPRSRRVEIVTRIRRPPGVRAPKGATLTGKYDPATGRITVVESASKLTLAHEYGHALLHDLLIRHPGTQPPAEEFTSLEGTDKTADADSIPSWLRTVFAEYRRLPETVYADPYYCQSFNEYFAESFARKAWGKKDVPPVMAAFLAHLETSGR